MATDLSLSLPKRKIEWTGKLYESQLVAVADKMQALSENLDERKAVLSQLNPTISEDELLTLLNQELVADLFSNKTPKLSLLVRNIFWSSFPALYSQFVAESTDEILFTLDADEFLAIFEAIGAALKSFAPEEEKEEKVSSLKKAPKKGFKKVEKSFAEVVDEAIEEVEKKSQESKGKVNALEAAQEAALDAEDAAISDFQDVTEAIAAESERSRKIAELRRQLDQLTEAPVPTEVA